MLCCDKMAAAGGMAMPIATQLVQYANDGVDVYYSDGSRLQLSPCGTAFRYYHPPYAGQHPLHGQKEIQQRTEFATSEFRPKVKDAVDFRNRFAERPFLCSGLLPTENVVRLHADITEVAWPSSLKDADVTVFPDGAVRLVSSDEYAAVTIAPHRQFITTEILSRLSQRRVRSQHNTTQRSTTTDVMPSTIASVPSSHNASRNIGEDSLHQHHSASFSLQLQSTMPHNSTPCIFNSKTKDCSISGIPEEHNNTLSADCEKKWDYIWVAQHHSLSDYPNCWSHPVEILQEYLSKNRSPAEDSNRTEPVEDKKIGETCKDNSTSVLNSSCISREAKLGESALSASERRAVTLQRLLKRDFAGCVFVTAPKSLPLNCPSLQLHRWRPEVVNSDDNDQAEAAYMYGKVKVICAQGIIYKLVWKNPRSVEIYPGDGSLMRSTGLSGHFFTHYMSRANKTEERTYSTQSPPPSMPGAPYSVAKLVTRGARFLKHLCEESLHSLLHEDPCCWAVKPGESEPMELMPTTLLEDCLVDNVGHFTAYSNGHIRILFADRTSLDMVCDFTKRVLSGADADTVKRYLKRPKPLGLSPGIVRLLLRTGHYHNVEVHDAAPYEHYVQSALHWAEWVGSSPTERQQFYKDTIYDQDKQQSIESELKKIKCFNYIVENTVGKTRQAPSGYKRPYSTPSTQRPIVSHPSSSHIPRTSLGGHVTGQGDHVTNYGTSQNSGSFNMSSIQDVLKKTAEAVADLDRFMQDAVNAKPGKI